MLNLFVSQTQDIDRGNVFFVERFESLPDGAYELVDVIEDQYSDVHFTWAEDEEVKKDSQNDAERFGESRYNLDLNELKTKTAKDPATLEAFGKILMENEALDEYDFVEAMPTLLKKSQDLYTAFTPILVEREILRTYSTGPFTIVRGFYTAALDERNTSAFAASKVELASVATKGIRFTRIPEAVSRDHRSVLSGMHWWGVIPEVPKFEFFGATRKSVEHLVAIYRASIKRYDESVGKIPQN